MQPKCCDIIDGQGNRNKIIFELESLHVDCPANWTPRFDACYLNLGYTTDDGPVAEQQCEANGGRLSIFLNQSMIDDFTQLM